MSRTVADIVVTEAPELETQLDRAVKTAIDAALKDGRQGVLVTRHDHCKFTVALTPEVRFGTTQARDLWEADLTANIDESQVPVKNPESAKSANRTKHPAPRSGWPSNLRPCDRLGLSDTHS
jgi:hypothetical protein